MQLSWRDVMDEVVHAKLAASAAERWLNCPASIRLSENFPDKGSDFAAEGTAAHKLAELLLADRLGYTDEFTAAEMEELQRSQYYKDEMSRCITNYVDWVIELFESVKRETPDAELLTEQRVDFSDWVPQGFGTSDVVILADDTMIICDLKYGKGVAVSAVYNPQLRLYALGAYEAFSMEYDIKKIRMIINQPRLDSISEDEIEVDRLLEWANDFVKPKAEAAYKGEGNPVPGEHCKFCKAKALCKARAKEAQALDVEMNEKNPGLLTDEQIANVLSLADRISSWVKDVKDYALEQATAGKYIEGYKLVEGRSVRKINEPDKVVEILTGAGYDKAVLYKAPELNGITALQSIVGKKNLESLIGDYIIKPPGAPTLVPNSDKRPAINGAAVYNDDYKEE